MSLQRIGVVGAGMMGSEIALVFALAGRQVLLFDADSTKLSETPDRWTALLDKAIARGLHEKADKARALQGLTLAGSLQDFADRQIVIEAVYEEEAVKAETFRQLDEIVPPDCILSSNTSSISISTLSSYVKERRRPRFLGTHFFSPVSRMKLVEVIDAFDTGADTLDAVMALCRDAGKEPVKVKDVVGFAVNRLLHALMIEATRLVEEGVATPEDIDKACRLGLGHPVGPFALMDLVSNRLNLQVQEILHEAYGPRFLPRPLLRQMVKAGRDGRQAGRGWLDYRQKPGKGASQP